MKHKSTQPFMSPLQAALLDKVVVLADGKQVLVREEDIVRARVKGKKEGK